jgi:hypothetical protein
MFDGERITLNQDGFEANLTGTLFNGAEREGVRMEGQARCAGSVFDELSFISLS